MHLALELTHGSFDLRMAGMPDQDHDATIVEISLAFVMHLGDERTDCIEDRQPAALGIDFDRSRHAMSAEDRHRAGGHLGQALDETRALRLEALDDMAVMDNLVANIDRCAISLERTLDDFDRTHHTRAKPTRLRQNDFHDPAPPRPPEPGCHPWLSLVRQGGAGSRYFPVAVRSQFAEIACQHCNFDQLASI
jgi:hypothetical protein